MKPFAEELYVKRLVEAALKVRHANLEFRRAKGDERVRALAKAARKLAIVDRYNALLGIERCRVRAAKKKAGGSQTGLFDRVA
jgi:predicted phage tail protein